MNQELILIYNPYLWFMLGSCWGSFLNVVFYRYPLGLSVVQPASACPHCNRPIPGYHNVPVFAWIWLRGKCANCKAPISVQYPLVEAFFGGLWLVAYFLHATTPGAGISLSFLLTGLFAGGYMLWRSGKAPWYLWSVFVIAAAGYLWSWL